MYTHEMASGSGNLMGQLKAELRETVRSIRDHSETFGDEWKAEARKLASLAAVIEKEQELVATETAGGGTARGTASPSRAATLWDNSSQYGVRCFLETGKLNLLLRMAADYCEHCIKALSTGSGSASSLCGEAADFERGTFTVLTALWTHREGLQTTDWGLAADVLARAMVLCVAAGEAGLRAHLFTAVFVLQALGAIAGGAEAVGEAKVVAALQKAHVFTLFPVFAAMILTSSTYAAGSTPAEGSADPAAAASGGAGSGSESTLGSDTAEGSGDVHTHSHAPAPAAGPAPAPAPGPAQLTPAATAAAALAGCAGMATLMATEEVQTARSAILKGAPAAVEASFAGLTPAPSSSAAAAAAVSAREGKEGDDARALPPAFVPACVTLKAQLQSRYASGSDMAVRRKVRLLQDFCDAAVRAAGK